LVKGTVLYVSPVADAVSQTRRVRVEIANTENWPAGTQARVRFSEPSDPGMWEKYLTSPGRSRAASESLPQFADEVRTLLTSTLSSFAYCSAPYMPSTVYAFNQISRFCRMDLYSSSLWETPYEWQTQWWIHRRFDGCETTQNDAFTRQDARVLAYQMVAESFGDSRPLSEFDINWAGDPEVNYMRSKFAQLNFEPSNLISADLLSSFDPTITLSRRTEENAR
jgi:hypothetical protein